VGLMGSGVANVSVGMLLQKRLQLIGTVLRARPLEEKIAVTQRFRAEVLPRFADGSLSPVIDSRYRLDDVADAHRRMEANENVGKLLLDA
jgi:NADPH2:quinone reductase